jgi:hypothetical protein
MFIVKNNADVDEDKEDYDFHTSIYESMGFFYFKIKEEEDVQMCTKLGSMIGKSNIY